MDGCKLNVNTPYQNWLNNKNLDFIGGVNYSTGELLQDFLWSKYKGQILLINKGKNSIHCNMRGSLATFYNEGKHNFFDYSYDKYLDTLPILESELGIIPSITFFRNIEFGVMFESPVKSNVLWDYMKYHKYGKFSNIVKSGKMVGVQIEHQRFILKFYDKGLQFTGKHSNIIKYEIVIKKMVEVEGMGLKTLEDLKNPFIWFCLSKKLIEKWNEIIIVDENIDYKAMRNYEQKKFLDFKNANFWNNLKLTTDDRKYLEKLNSKYQNETNIKDVINNLIVEKCIKNVTEKNKEITSQLTEFFKPTFKHKQIKKSHSINHYDKGLNITLKHSQEQEIKGGGEKAQKKITKCKCRDCRKSLRNKKSNALFCSNACRQKFHNHKKKAQIKNERAILESVVNKKANLNILLGLKYYNEKSGNYDYLKGDEVMITNEVIKSLKEVLLIRKPSEKPQRLTHARARGLVRYLSDINSGSVLAG